MVNRVKGTKWGQKKPKRKVSQKEPRGKSGANVLICMAEQTPYSEEPTYLDYQDVLPCMAKKHNIRNRDTIKGHLTRLREKGLVLSETAQGSRFPRHALKHGFIYFSELYHYIKKNGVDTDFLKTRYCTDFITSKEFKQKLLINIFKRGILELDSKLKTREGYDRIKKEIEERLATLHKYKNLNKFEKREEANLTRLIQALNEVHLKTGDEFAVKYKGLIRDLKSHSVDELPQILLERAKSRGNTAEDYKIYQLEYMPTIVLPDSEWENLQRMMMVSPAAFNYAIDPRYPDPGLLNTLASYYLNVDFLEHRIFMGLSGWDLTNLWEEGHTPMYSIIKSFFITDLVTGKIIKTDYSPEILEKIFQQKKMDEELYEILA